MNTTSGWLCYLMQFCRYVLHCKEKTNKSSVKLSPPSLAADDRTAQSKNCSHSAASVLLGWAATRDKDLISSMILRANMLVRLALPEA